MMKYDLERQSRIIAALRVPLMLLIVLIHIPLAEEEGRAIWHSNLSFDGLGAFGMFAYYYISKLLSFNIGIAAVPCFFLFSGYYMFYKEKDWLSPNTYAREMGKRCWTLLIPYVFWSLLALCLALLRTKLQNSFFGEQEPLVFDTVSHYLYSSLWLNTYNLPLWYIKDLIILSLLSPVIYILAKKAPWILVPLFVAYIYSYDVVLAARGVFYFLLGAILATRKVDMISEVERYKAIILPLFIVSSLVIPFADNVAYAMQLKYLYVPLVISFFFIIAGYAYDKRPALIAKLGGLSTLVFFVYVSHEVQILSIVKGVFYDYGLLNTIPGYFASAALVVAICVALYYIANRFFPKQLAFVLGRE